MGMVTLVNRRYASTFYTDEPSGNNAAAIELQMSADTDLMLVI